MFAVMLDPQSHSNSFAVAALLVVVQVDPKRNLFLKVLIKSMSAAVERITTPFALLV